MGFVRGCRGDLGRNYPEILMAVFANLIGNLILFLLLREFFWKFLTLVFKHLS